MLSPVSVTYSIFDGFSGMEGQIPEELNRHAHRIPLIDVPQSAAEELPETSDRIPAFPDLEPRNGHLIFSSHINIHSIIPRYMYVATR